MNNTMKELYAEIERCKKNVGREIGNENSRVSVIQNELIIFQNDLIIELLNQIIGGRIS